MGRSDAERLKFQLFAHGMTIAQTARQAIAERLGDTPLSSADFASTSGIILRLDDAVWVNAPLSTFNPNFVGESPYILERVGDEFVVSGLGLASRACLWLQPAYHGATNSSGRRLNDFVVTHGDRVRLSPVQGCGMVCTFCDVPYGDRYGIKPVDEMLGALSAALRDPAQPVRHVLVSGGTPKSGDVPWLRDVYRAVLTAFPEVPVDIMMTPVPGLLEVLELRDLGVNELSINLELFSDDAARRLMPQKYRAGRAQYLAFIANAAGVLGLGRVRSMLMVGLEPSDQTLLGVRAIVEHGGVPVLSPFRPDPQTPLASTSPPSAAQLEDIFDRAEEIVTGAGLRLGPSCLPCTHNTLTLGTHDSWLPGTRDVEPLLI